MAVLVGLVCAWSIAADAQAAGRICAVDWRTGGCAERPHRFGYGAHASVYGIRWATWGQNRAVGYGHILWHRTVSEPSFGPYAAKVVFTEPAECDRATWYSRRTIKIGRRFGRALEQNAEYGPCYYT